MKISTLVAAISALVILSAASASAQQPYLFKFVFKGTSYQKDGSGNIVGVPITDQTIINDRAAATGVNPSTLTMVYHLGADPRGDTVDIMSANNVNPPFMEWAFWFGDDPSFGRSALTNTANTEIRRVDQLFTLYDTTYSSANSHGMGSAFTTKKFVTDSGGNVHATFEGTLQYMVVQGPNTKMITGSFTASQPYP